MEVVRNDFNCTIQELKLHKDFGSLVKTFHFNCTIQELKLFKQEEDTT